MKKLLLTTALIIVMGGCDQTQSTPSAENIQAAQTKQAQNEANREIGMPAIVNFQERRMMKDLYEKRDTTLATHSYVMNQMRGCLIYLGASIGYGLPYATQFTNPQRVAYEGGYQQSFGSMPQPEPNGLYMPTDAHGTWIMLLNPETKKAEPQYVEPDVIVSTFRMINNECK